MEPVIIALGSNVGDRRRNIQAAKQFLRNLSKGSIRTSAIYLTEPVGPATRYFLNAVVEITSDLSPENLILRLKKYENKHGRPTNHPRWSARTIDLDIIAYGRLVIEADTLIIPHPEYAVRLFVLEPLRDIHPNWRDPKTGLNIQEMITKAPEMQVKKTNLAWQHE